MKLFKILLQTRYLVTALIGTIAMLIFFPTFQSLGNLEIWFTFTQPVNFILYLIFSILFGITIAIQYYAYKQKVAACQLKSTSARAGSILGLFAFQCPACVPVLGLVLGLDAVTFLSAYRTQLMIIGLALMFLSLYLLGAFKK